MATEFETAHAKALAEMESLAARMESGELDPAEGERRMDELMQGMEGLRPASPRPWIDRHRQLAGAVFWAVVALLVGAVMYWSFVR